ncbi:MAG: CBS domain-containing protein, partial [Alphaproteobacteria bacterium]|nr:CBS domain-containing protein [Alphaproteobacteria bacterium]
MAFRTVSQLVHDQVILAVATEISVRQATRQMDARNVGAVLVTDPGGRLVGI